MAVKIKLKRLGKIRNPQYRIVIADARNKRDGRSIEEIGLYHPKEEPSLIRVDSDRAQYWLSVGAQPTEAVTVILKITGDWQKFKGLPGQEGTLRVAEPKPGKHIAFASAAAEAASLKTSSDDKRGFKKPEPAAVASPAPAESTPAADSADSAEASPAADSESQ
ncbi:MAG: 30S ribosomal protein S16 [Actinomycetes bacterium]